MLVIDHYVPEQDDESRRIVRIARDWAREQRLPHVYDSQGICHVVVPQHGHLRPGMFCVGGDSHSPTGGAFGAYMFGIGATEMLGVVVSGEIWLEVPQTIFMQWSGRLADGVSAKDIILALIAGTAVGIPLSRVPLTAVPQRTALSHAFGGLAAGLVGTAKFFLYHGQGNAQALSPFIVIALVAEILLVD